MWPSVGVGEGQDLHALGHFRRGDQQVVDFLAAVRALPGNHQSRRHVGATSHQIVDRGTGCVAIALHHKYQLVIGVILLEQRFQIIGQLQVITLARHVQRDTPAILVRQGQLLPPPRKTSGLPGLTAQQDGVQPPQGYHHPGHGKGK